MDIKGKEVIHLGNRNRTLSRNKHISRQKVVAVSPTGKPFLRIQNVIETHKNKRPKQNIPFVVLSTTKPSFDSNIERQNKTVIKSQIILGNSAKFTQPQNNNQNIVLTQRVFHSPNQRLYVSQTQRAKRLSANQVLSPRLKQQFAVQLNHHKVSKVSFVKHQQKTSPLEHQTQQLTQRECQLLNKLKIAENRVAQLNCQKINIQANLTDQNLRLFHENQHFKALIEKFNSQQITNNNHQILQNNHHQQSINISQAQQGTNNQRKTIESKQDLIDKLGEMEHMLESETFKTLQLKDQNQLLKKQLQDVQSQLFVLKTLYTTIGQQTYLINSNHTNQISYTKHSQNNNSQINLTQQIESNPIQLTYQLRSKIESLNIQIRNLQKQRQYILEKVNAQSNLVTSKQQTIFDDKDEIILELNRKIYAYQLHLQTLAEQNNNNITINDSNSNQSKQCHKCQQLMNTVLKLNTHLNKP